MCIGFALLQNCNNSTFVDRHGLILEDNIGRFNGNDPAGFDEQIDRCVHWAGCVVSNKCRGQMFIEFFGSLLRISGNFEN